MLGRLIEDPFKVETELGEINGMGLLDIRTVFAEKKVTTRVQGSVIDKQIPVYGYEIHMGISSYGEKAKPFIKIENKVGIDDGAVNEGGNIMGTYIHGIFDGANFREYIINFLRDKKGIERKKSVVYEDVRNGEIDRLADIVRNSLDMNSIYSVMGIEGKK